MQSNNRQNTCRKIHIAFPVSFCKVSEINKSERKCVAASDGVSTPGLGLETSLVTHFIESPPRS